MKGHMSGPTVPPMLDKFWKNASMKALAHNEYNLFELHWSFAPVIELPNPPKNIIDDKLTVCLQLQL